MMPRSRWFSLAALLTLAAFVLTAKVDPGKDEGLTTIKVDYPLEDSIFPADFSSPTFLWRDESQNAVRWQVGVTFGDGSQIHSMTAGEPMQVGEIDPRCVAPTNELPKLTPEQAAAHGWRPDAEIWAAIKKGSTGRAATVTITGYLDDELKHTVSRGQVTIQTSKDPVGAPILYRDVPLMPNEDNKVVTPLARSAMGLIAWRLRYVAEPRSRLLMSGLPSCGNCHSFSLDGKTIGMDLDGPGNDKGMYALAAVRRKTSLRNEDVIKPQRAKRWHLVADEIRPLPVRHNVGRALCDEEKVRLLKTAAAKPEWQLARLAMTLALNTTMRACEIKGLRWRDVSFIEQALSIKQSKTAAGERVIPLNADAMAVIQELWNRAKAFGGTEPHHFVFAACESGKVDPSISTAEELADCLARFNTGRRPSRIALS